MEDWLQTGTAAKWSVEEEGLKAAAVTLRMAVQATLKTETEAQRMAEEARLKAATAAMRDIQRQLQRRL